MERTQFDESKALPSLFAGCCRVLLSKEKSWVPLVEFGNPAHGSRSEVVTVWM